VAALEAVGEIVTVGEAVTGLEPGKGSFSRAGPGTTTQPACSARPAAQRRPPAGPALTAKAASVAGNVDALSYIICARSEIVIPQGSGTVTITARDIFPDPV
jgi:hypothetical protein